MSAAPPTRHLVLVGGGHAHVEVLARFGRRPEPGMRLTLVSRDIHTAYSGMLPGLVAGIYSQAEAQIDLPRLAAATGAEFIRAEIDGLDLGVRAVLAGGRVVARYDLLSLDTGASPDLSVPGAGRHALPVKPVPEFLAASAWIKEAARKGPLRIAIVGGGVGGAELSLALRAGLGGGSAHSITLITRDTLAPEINERARRRLAAALRRHAVGLVENEEVAEVEREALVTASGRRFSFDHLVWATWARAPDWLGRTGLRLDERGFVAVADTLRSLDAPDVFAVGDVAGVLAHPRPKAGVFAVRQGPPLADNLRRVLRGEAPRAFTPQRTGLALIGTGDGRAIAAKGPFALEGAWVWRMKRWIDRRWMAKYRRRSSRYFDSAM